jgi:hypothetical protein
MATDAGGCVRGTGKFLAIQRGDGSLDVTIESRDRSEPDPYVFNRIPVSQAGIDLLEKSKPGSKCAFCLIDPQVAWMACE